MMNKSDFIRKANELGRKAEPFLFVIDFELKKPVIISPDKAKDSGIYFDIKNMTNWNYTDFKKSLEVFKTKSVSKEDYIDSFNFIKKNLLQGNTYLTNLTFPTAIENKSELKEIFNAAKAPYKLLFRDEFTVFSPECFIRISGDQIFSYPMKGTIDASVENAEEIILSDRKELYEHNTIVDLIRNDISQVAEKVYVSKFRYIDKIKSNNKDLLQVSSEITGELHYNWQKNLGNLLIKMLPAGSVSGAPKQKTLEIIKKAEGLERGYYTGIFGYFDGKDLDSAVNIRYLEKKDGKLFFRSGGGITALSNHDPEYSELLNKVYVPVG
jgi:para-aminobenzoate synthetase component I